MTQGTLIGLPARRLAIISRAVNKKLHLCKRRIASLIHLRKDDNFIWPDQNLLARRYHGAILGRPYDVSWFTLYGVGLSKSSRSLPPGRHHIVELTRSVCSFLALLTV